MLANIHFSTYNHFNGLGLVGVSVYLKKHSDNIKMYVLVKDVTSDQPDPETCVLKFIVKWAGSN
jgi:hypothetical protein